jgi:DNA modification methylase
MKPVELVERAINNSSRDNGLIIDWFLGSGTTIIAAHRTGRRCYGCEISPEYCEIILQRCEAEGLTVEKDGAEFYP